MIIRVRRGLDLAVSGEPAPEIDHAPETGSIGVLVDEPQPGRFELLREPGESVALGQAVLRDRRDPRIVIPAPGAGAVSEVLRGERRSLMGVVIALHGNEERRFPAYDLGQLATLERGVLVERLLEAGAWTALRTRPFGSAPGPDALPPAIFVRAMDTRPLAPDVASILRERPDDLRFGLAALARLSAGAVYVCTSPFVRADVPLLSALAARSDTIDAAALTGRERIRVVEFSGAHPAGLSGTHIHCLHRVPSPARFARAGAQSGHGPERVWYVGHQEVLAIGHLLRTGRIDPMRVVSLAGPLVREPRLLRVRLGASSEELVSGELEAGTCRLVAGSLLAGRRVARPRAFLGRHDEQLCAIPEREEPRRGAWLVPRWQRAQRVPPWRRAPEWTSALQGKPTAMLPLDLFDRVVPLRIPVGLLLRALAARDVDGALAAGALEVEEEDLALCSFLCPAKLDYGSLLRKTLNELEARLP